ncbi:MAG: hypothetical protein DRP68_06370 [Candidatus Omnitrophota bacterium]|nr:MerR family transcriptional regulator [Candidatus Omnitrophota bacterium]RKY30196.1 MAG: hypothetical protein DRP68_06370 [Candidatus Omnitrophota bacterium]RKY37024.1 MAG: hypothetical protein DRP72_03550 [Candidatus Omnitrophota bacterium]RKY46030.1 MAG: hypothetical protein DRP81_01970 [Candidatus Omnitrophota bacterium]
MSKDKKLTITQVAKKVGVVPKTIIRWEKAGKIRRAKRDWRGWRVYTQKELEELKNFRNSLY